MANNFSPVGGEIQINLFPNQIGDQGNPDIGALTDGRFFLAFSDVDPVSGVNIIGQFASPDGTLSGGNIDIDIGAGDQAEPAVAARSAGAAVVVWHDKAASDEIHYAIVSGAGVAGT